MEINSTEKNNTMNHPNQFAQSISFHFMKTHYHQQIGRNRKLSAIFGLLFIVSVCAPAMYAQGDLPTSEVEVVKQFEARLIESQRIPVEPGEVVVKPLPHNFDYDVIDHQESISYDPPVIKPRGYRTGKGPEAYRGFLKAGAGWPLNYLGQFGYRFDLDRDRNANVYADLRGLNDGKIENRKVMNANVKGDMNWYTDLGLKLNGFAGYQRDMYHYYNPPVYVDSLTTNKVSYSDFSIGASLKNYEENALGIDYEIGLEGKFLKSSFAQKNHTFNIQGKVSKSFGESVLLEVGLASYNDSYEEIKKIKQNYFELNPVLSYSTGRFRLSGGVYVLSSGDDASIKPDAEIEYGILPNRLHAFIGADGGYQINSLRSLITENPFMAHTMDSLQITNTIHYYGGVKGTISAITYNLQGGYRLRKDLPIFQLDPPINPLEPHFLLYAPVFDDAQNIYGELSVSMPLLDNLNLYTLIRYDHYEMDVLPEAYYIPSTKVQLGGKYSMLEGRLNLGADFSFLTAVKYPENEFEKPNAVFDINLNGEYLFTDNFGAFIQLNNLADSRYIRWQDYEGLGLNVLAGISVRFK